MKLFAVLEGVNIFKKRREVPLNASTAVSTHIEKLLFDIIRRYSIQPLVQEWQKGLNQCTNYSYCIISKQFSTVPVVIFTSRYLRFI